MYYRDYFIEKTSKYLIRNKIHLHRHHIFVFRNDNKAFLGMTFNKTNFS